MPGRSRFPVAILAALVIGSAPAPAQPSAPQGLSPGLRWQENHAGMQLLAVPESEHLDGPEDRLFLVPHVATTSILWDAETSAAADGSTLVKAVIRDLVSTTVEPGRMEPVSRPTEHKDAWFAFRAGTDGTFHLDGWKTSKKPDDAARATVTRDFLVLMPLEPGLQDVGKREPGKEWLLTGIDALRLYRFDLPQAEFVKSAEVRIWLQVAGTDPAGGNSAVLKATVRTEVERQGRIFIRTGEGLLRYDLDRRMLRSYRFSGDVRFTVPIEKRKFEFEGTWSSSGMRDFR